mmetsp:Transcript_656/g.705  ORF Transcript_656/g.705 Transcript_656/m.705 type:complete len:96 (+) Transcript_656:277-564(+)
MFGPPNLSTITPISHNMTSITPNRMDFMTIPQQLEQEYLMNQNQLDSIDFNSHIKHHQFNQPVMIGNGQATMMGMKKTGPVKSNTSHSRRSKDQN